MVVSLHSLSTERGHGERGCRKRAIIETDEREEIACVGRPEAGQPDTRRVKGRKSNSYNEEFDPGSG